MARGGLGNPRAPDRVLDRPLEDGLVQVVAAALTGHAVYIEASRWKDPLPSPGSAGVRVLAQERAGQLDPPRAVPEIAFVLPAHTLEVGAQLSVHRGRQRRWRTARTSSCVSTTGKYTGRLALTTSSSHGNSMPSTSR